MKGTGADTASAGRRPLAGRTVVVTRPREQAEALAGPLEALGAEVLIVPTIRIVPRPPDDEVLATVRSLADYQLVVFTSANAARIFAGYLEGEATCPAAPTDLRRGGRPVGKPFARAAVAAIGPATAAALEAHGIVCDLVADDFVAEGLLDALQRRGVASAGARVLVPRAREARSILPDTLRARGAVVDVLPVYDTVAAHALAVPAARIEAADYITFTSSSSVREFAALMAGAGPRDPRALAERLSAVRLCSIGPVTSGTLRALGLPVAVEAREHTAAGLAEALAATT